MEITVVSGAQPVQSENAFSTSSCSSDVNLISDHASKDIATDHPHANDESKQKGNYDEGSNHQKSNVTNPNNNSQDGVKKSLLSMPKNCSDSKFSRPRSSDKLAQVIETCKKLQKLSKQNAPNMRQEGGDAKCSAVTYKGCDLNSATPETPEVSVDLPKHIQLDHCLLVDNVGKDFLSNSPPVNSLSAPDSQFASEPSGDLALKRFLFLFRPTDHEVLVRNKGINMYRCNVCGGMYRQKFSLKRHFLRTHINFRYISKADISNCKIAVPHDHAQKDSTSDCSETPNGRKKFSSSNAIFLENNKERVMPGLYICHLCVDVRFDHEQDLRDHYNLHSDVERKRFQCDKCSASFFKKQILSRHLASHGEKVHRKVCKRCGAEFSSKLEYQRHLLSHSSGRVCKYCSKILSTSANRKRHESLHLGLKPYRCSHCGMSFSQSKDLDRHLKKQHTDICHCCEACNKLFPSQATLDVHVNEKHTGSTPRRERPASPEVHEKPAAATTPPVKLKVCYVCKRSFQTFYAMMKHRQQAHPYHKKRKKHRKAIKQTLAQSNQSENDLSQGTRRPYVKRAKPNGTIPNPTVRRGRPPIERAVKFGRHAERSGPRFLTKRERELAKREEMEFYCNLSGRIAENLLHFVDGKTSQLSLKAYNFNEHHHPCYNFEERGRLPWSSYNFPNGYDVDYALKTRGQEVKNKSPENLSSRDKCLFATGLNRVLAPPQVTNVENGKQDESSNNVVINVNIPVAGIHKQELNLEERKKLIGREIATAFLCYVCKEKFYSDVAFKDHCVNNHPNVQCSCIEIEGNENSPPIIPEDLCKQDITPDGIFFSWNVPPPLSELSLLKCTKCKSDFKTSLELHSHIILCGNLKSSPTHVWKFKAQKRIKRTMKNRMSLEQQAAVKACNRSFKTPEKCQFNPNYRTKSNEKVSKSSEKFYKSGRLQTASFAVDMNYFKTKPMKPTVNTISKRGRKSYATLSYRYRYASLNSSSSLECSECKQTFSSQSSLNLHMQNHFIQLKEGRKKQSSPDKLLTNVTSVRNMSTATSDVTSWDNSRFSQHKIACPIKSRQSFIFDRTNAPSFPYGAHPKSKNDSLCTSETEKASTILDLTNSNSTANPVDLSKSSNIDCNATLDLSFKIKSAHGTKKSALEQAMEAIKKYYQNPEQNEHIFKLQKTVENLPTPNKIMLPPLSKSASAKKVGRPKKVKRLGPLRFRKRLSLESSKNMEQTRLEESISKLEGDVKELSEYKEKSDVTLPEQKTCPIKENNTSKDSPLGERKLVALNTNVGKHLFDKAIEEQHEAATSETISNIVTANTAKNFVPTTNVPENKNKLTCISELNNNDLSINSPLRQSVSVNALPANPSQEFHNSGNDMTSDKTFKDSCELNLPSASNSDFPAKKCERSRRSSGSQGRISPSLESIVNSIKQKLHSQEQESCPHDDVALSWLEDEKFEIPPSKRKLKLPGSANSDSSLSADNENFILKSNGGNVFCDPIELTQESKVSNCENTKMLASSSAIITSANSFDISKKGDSMMHEESDACNSKENDKSKDRKYNVLLETTSSVSEEIVASVSEREADKKPTTAVSDNQNFKHALTAAEKDKDFQASITKSNKCAGKSNALPLSENKSFSDTTLNSLNQKPVRKKPGRPRKKVPDSSINTEDSENCSNPPKLDLKQEASGSISTYSKLSGNNSAVFQNVQLTNPPKDQNILHGTSALQTCNFPSSACQKSLTAMIPENIESREINSNQPESNSEGKTSSLRAFRTKSKQSDLIGSECDSTINTKVTTEFGKNLASRMKEKMRLSFENASFENILKSDEGNSDNIPDSSISDVNSQISDDDSEYCKAIKKEIESSEPTKKHGCPFCRLEFAYLTNFRRHLRICKARYESKEVELIPSTSATVLQYLPKKDEVEHSMLNLLRHQSRQTQMLKEAEKSTGSKVESKFRTYSCNVCHRIYLSLFKLLQHQVTHKLVPPNSSETNSINADLENTKDMGDMEKYGTSNELENNAINNSEFCKSAVERGMKLVIDDQEPAATENTETQLICNSSNTMMNAEDCTDHVNERKPAVEMIDNLQSDTTAIKFDNGITDTGSNQSDGIAENLNSNKMVVKIEDQPAKPKRGRPFGRRKNSIVLQSNVKEAKKDHKARESAIVNSTRKGDKLHQSPMKRRRKKLLFTRLKMKTKKVISDKINKILSSEFDCSADEDIPLSIVCNNKAMQVLHIKKEPQNSSLTKEEETQNPKHKIPLFRSKTSDAHNISSSKQANYSVATKGRKKSFPRLELKSNVTSKLLSLKRSKHMSSEKLFSNQASMEMKSDDEIIILQSTAEMKEEKPKIASRRSSAKRIDSFSSPKELKNSDLIENRQDNILTQMKMVSGNSVTNETNKISSIKCSDVAASADSPLNLVTTDEVVQIKLEEDDYLQSPPAINKDKQKSSLKRSFNKSKSIKVDTSSSKDLKNDFQAEMAKGNKKLHINMISKENSSVTQSKPEQIQKRPRGRPPASSKISQTAAVKKEFPNKRRPGRPPKVLLCVPSTSQSKGIYTQSVSSRNFRKSISRSIPIDSSDSEYDLSEKQDITPKKKVVHFKICPICKEKFPASLILYRHIQLVHSRRSQAAAKSDSPGSPKTSKKSFPRSSAANSSPETVKISKKPSPKQVTEQSNDGSGNVFKKVSPKSITIETLDDNKKITSKLSLVKFLEDSDMTLKQSTAKANVRCTNEFKEADRKLFPVSAVRGVKAFKRRKPKVAVDSNNRIPNYFKKVPSTVDIDSSSVSEITDNIAPQFFANLDVDNLNHIKKINVGPVTNKSDTSARNAKKSPVKNIAGGNPVVSNKKIAKVTSKSNTDGKSIIVGAKRSKRIGIKLISEDNSDTVTISKQISSGNNSEACSIKNEKKLASKSGTDYNFNAENFKNYRKMRSKCNFDDNSDAESAKNSKRNISKLITTYNSDSESPKMVRSVSQSLDNSDADSDFSVKTDVTPMRHCRKCPICKEKFSASTLLYRHIQLVHSRRTNFHNITEFHQPLTSTPCDILPPVKIKVENPTEFPLPLNCNSSPTDANEDDTINRSALPRQCRKPLPPMKRKWIKKEQI